MSSSSFHEHNVRMNLFSVIRCILFFIQKLINQIERLTTEHQHAEVILGFDTDTAGHNMRDQVKTLLQGRQVYCEEPSIGKDFNEMLLALSK